MQEEPNFIGCYTRESISSVVKQDLEATGVFSHSKVEYKCHRKAKQVSDK